MSKSKCDILIGTSGWHYDDWAGRFYPADLPKSKWLRYYAEHFDTVEINNTFYRQPKPETFAGWHEQAPKNFLYTIKANRYITHVKRLKDPENSLDKFLKGVLLLKSNLGSVLYQLPPNMHKNLDRLRFFMKFLPEKLISVFEFRHESWFSEDTYELLREFNAPFCIHDMTGMEIPRIITSDVVYIRFHGPTGKYAGNYPESELRDWAGWIKNNLKGKRAVFAYFNNDIEGHAVSNAKMLREQLL